MFEGKRDLDKRLGRKIRGYRKPGAQFMILRDQDSGDCMAIKQQLRGLIPEHRHNDCVIRIVCRELESFYLGDLRAVEQGMMLIRWNNIAAAEHAKIPGT